jgi:hypothetical protein
VSTVLIDANNVRRSVWPNISDEELTSLCEAWSQAHRHEVDIVFDGPESADDQIARKAAELRAADLPFWLVTSDRGLRARAKDGADRVVGGGSFARELLKLRA